MQIQITDLKKNRATKEESFLKNRFNVISRSGLNITEKKLIELLPLLWQPEKVLFVDNRTGASAMILNSLYPHTEISIHCLDVHHANTIKNNLSINNNRSINVCSEPYIDKKQEFDSVFYQLSHEGLNNELVLDLLQQIHQALAKEGKCFISIEKNDRWLLDQIKKVFGNHSITSNDKKKSCVVGKKKQKLKRVRSYEGEFEMTIFGKNSVRLFSIPGVFSHRRVDQGAQALSEIVESLPDDSLLDMGCGCGAVGISIAKNQNLRRVCFVDSNPRAIFITKKNCEINSVVNYEALLSDSGLLPNNCGFSLFVGNPPYFSNYKISSLFIDTAFNSLDLNGRAYIVAKNAEWHFDYMKKLFNNAELFKRRGYQVVKSVKLK